MAAAIYAGLLLAFQLAFRLPTEQISPIFSGFQAALTEFPPYTEWIHPSLPWSIFLIGTGYAVVRRLHFSSINPHHQGEIAFSPLATAFSIHFVGQPYLFQIFALQKTSYTSIFYLHHYYAYCLRFNIENSPTQTIVQTIKLLLIVAPEEFHRVAVIHTIWKMAQCRSSAVIGSAIIFAICHAPHQDSWEILIVRMVGGIYYAWLYIKGLSLRGLIIAHLLYDIWVSPDFLWA